MNNFRFKAIDEVTPFLESLTGAEKSKLGKIPHNLVKMRTRNLIDCKSSPTVIAGELVTTFRILGTSEAFIFAALGTNNCG